MTADAWWEIMERTYSILSDVVCEFGGWVDSFTGDGVAAVFSGCGTEAEDAERACSGALALRDQLGAYGRALRNQRCAELMVRIGVNSGEVVVGRVGGARSRPAVAVGHAIGLAKRIESIAGPGTVYISGSTASLIDESFHIRSLGMFEIRGAPAPIQVYQLVERCSEIPYGLAQGIPCGPFVVLA